MASVFIAGGEDSILALMLHKHNIGRLYTPGPFTVTLYTSYLGPGPALHHKYCTPLTWDLAQPFTISIVHLLPGT